MPVVPLSQLRVDKENVRPARGQRASLEADQAVADRVQVALEELKSLGDSGDGVKYAEFFGEQLRKMPEVSMQSMWQLNWGNEVATEQKRSE